jgi:hypothetical protein
LPGHFTFREPLAQRAPPHDVMSGAAIPLACPRN